MRTELIEAVSRLIIAEEFTPELVEELNREEGFCLDRFADANVVLTAEELAAAVGLAGR